MQTKTEVRYHVAVKLEGQFEARLFGACADRRLALARAKVIGGLGELDGRRIERVAIVMRLQQPGSSRLRFMVEDYSGASWNLGRARWTRFSAAPWFRAQKHEGAS